MKQNETHTLAQSIDGTCSGCTFSHKGYSEHVPGANSSCSDWDCSGPRGTPTQMIVVPRAAARATDPETSHTAAAAVTTKVASIKQRILIDLSVHGGQTGKELAARSGIPLNSITPRFAELSGKKYATRMCISIDNVPPSIRRIKDSGERRDGQIVWVAA